MQQPASPRRRALVPLAAVSFAAAAAALLNLFGVGKPGDASAPPAVGPRAPLALDHLALVSEPHFDDFDGIAERRIVRALVAPSRTFYFFDGAVQRGLSYEMLKAFEQFLNDRLGTGALKISLVFVPVTRDQLLPALAAGYGGLTAAFSRSRLSR